MGSGVGTLLYCSMSGTGVYERAYRLGSGVGIYRAVSSTGTRRRTGSGDADRLRGWGVCSDRALRGCGRGREADLYVLYFSGPCWRCARRGREGELSASGGDTCILVAGGALLYEGYRPLNICSNLCGPKPAEAMKAEDWVRRQTATWAASSAWD